MTTLNLQVGASSDDCYRRLATSAFSLTNDQYFVGDYSSPSWYDYSSGFRFNGVTIGQGDTIDAATVKLRATALDTAIPTTYLEGEDADDAATFVDDADYDGRSRTAGPVTWTPGAWVADTWYTSAEIKAIIQTIVDRGGWSSGNDLVTFWRGAPGWPGSEQRLKAKSWDWDTALAAKLDIDYDAVGPEERSVAGSQPAATGTLTRKEQALRAMAGAQPAPSGTVARTAAAFLRTVVGNQPAATGAVAQSAGSAFTRTVAGAQPAPAGALSRLERALRAIAGAQPASSGTLTRKEQALRAVAGDQPTATGTALQSAGSAFSRATAGSQPTSTGTLTRVEQALRAIAGAQAAPSGAVARVHRRLRSIAGNQPAALGTIAAVLLVTRRTITGVQPAPSGTLTKVGTFARSLAGDQPNPTGALTRTGAAFIRSLAGSQPAAVGVLVRSKHWARSIAGDQALATGTVIARTLVLVAVPGAQARLAPFSPSVAVVVTNLDENPSFEIDAVGVEVIQGASTYGRDNTYAKFGDYSYMLKRESGDSALLRWYKYRQDDSRFLVTPGRTYIHSLWSRLGPGQSSVMHVDLSWYDAAGNFIDNNYTFYAVYDEFIHLTHVEVAPANAATVHLRMDSSIGWGVGDILYVDGEELREEDAYSAPYVDGDQEGHYWLDVPHASVSARAPALSLPRGQAIAERTMEGVAVADRPLASGKAR